MRYRDCNPRRESAAAQLLSLGGITRMKISEPEAKVIAQQLVQDERVQVGAICRISHHAREDYPEKARRGLDHGNWLVSFAYIGRPLTEDEKHFLPPLDRPTTVVVNDETGAAEFLAAL